MLPNPFIVDSTVVRRCYFYSPPVLQGDINNDNNVNIIDVVILVDFILGCTNLWLKRPHTVVAINITSIGHKRQ